MKKLFTYLILLHLLFLDINLFSQESQRENSLDTLKWMNGDVHSFHMTKLSLLGMEGGRKSDDSLRIRIFVNPSLVKPDRIIELRFNDNKWKGYLINYNLEYDDENGMFYAKKIRKKKVKPKRKWNTFIDQLIGHDLLTLPDQDLIVGYPIIMDGISFCVEISTQLSYRFYCYSNPGIAKNEIEEAAKMEFIIEEIYSELNIK